MNPNKCAFGVSAGEFLGFLVHEGGIEVGKKSMKAIDEVVPPTNLKELQPLLAKINFVRRFISSLSQKVLPFSPLLRIKKESLLSNGSLLWWGAALLDWFFPFVRHGLRGFFLWRSKERRHEVVEVYASGFAEHQGGYFISCESALGVMTGWRILMGIPNGRVFSPNAKGFSLNSVRGSRMRIFYGFYAKG
jgi:hypothetical protein